MKTKKLFFVLTLLFISTSLFANWNWHKKAPLLGHSRDQATGFSIGGYGYVCCGMDTNNITQTDLWMYDPIADTWTQKANIIGAARRGAFGFSINGKGYIGGGIADSSTFGTVFADFFEYDPSTNMWTGKTSYTLTTFVSPIYRAPGTACNGKGYVIGGRGGFSSSSNILEYNPTTDTWASLALFPGVPTSSGGRDGGAACSIGTKVYFGTGRDDSFFQNDWWEFDPALNTWTRKADFPGTGRTKAFAFTLSGKGIVGGGNDGGNKADCWWFDDANNQWNYVNNLNPARYAVAAFEINGNGYVATGKINKTTADCYELIDEAVVIGVENVSSKMIQNVFPNPAIGNYFTIQLTNELSHAHYSIYNLEGKLIQQKNISTAQIEINRTTIPAGVYMIAIENSNQVLATQKIILN